LKLLSSLHRWAGGLIGLLLALLGLSGAVLVWEGSWVFLPGASDPVVEQPGRIAAIVESAAAGGELSRITFASDEIGLHLVTNTDGSGAYVRQDGTVTDSWTSQWERPELWLFDFHHHLFAGHTGETITGIAGIAGLLFVITGLILWLRGRARFRPTILPRRFAPGPIVKHHRDLGLLVSPLLLLSMTTGVLMLFSPIRDAVIGKEERPEFEIAGVPSIGPAQAVLRAKALFPDAALRRISLSRESGDIVVRMRQPFEWTPQGRTQVTFRPDGTAGIEDAVAANRPAWISEKLYPLHSAKVGGVAMKLLMTLSGLALFVLGSFATWSFWFRRWTKRRKGAARPAAQRDFARALR
jgi:uncharacterized iron-regulated membrane protein